MRTVVLLVLTACGGKDGGGDGGPADTGNPGTTLPSTATFVPGDVVEISSGNPLGQDEDPAVLVTGGGVLTCAWYTNRTGPKERQIFWSQSEDGVEWTSPFQLTDGGSWAFTPSLAQGPDGTLYMAWWRDTLLPQGCNPNVDCTQSDNRVELISSAADDTWTTPVEVSGGPGDWLPSVVATPDGRVLVYFAAVVRGEDGQQDLFATENHLYVAELQATGGFGPVTRLPGTFADGFQDSYPAVALQADGTFLLTWTRWDAAGGTDPSAIIGETTTETMVATSTDGYAFFGARAVSDPASTDVFPWAFADADGVWKVAWETAGPGEAGREVVAPVDGGSPVDRPEIAGYSAKILATPTPGVDWAVWVSGEEPTQKIDSLLFAP